MYEYLKGSGEQWGGAEGVRCHLPTHELPTPAPKPWLSQNELFFVPHLFIPLNLSLTPPVPEYRYFNAGKYVLFLKIIHIEFFRKLQIDIHTQ